MSTLRWTVLTVLWIVCGWTLNLAQSQTYIVVWSLPSLICLEVRGNCSVLYCVLKLCTVISTLTWAVLIVFWIGFCHTGPISLCVDLFVFICVYFVCFCIILHSCCIVSKVGWTRWDWSLILRTYLPSVLWHCWLGHLTHKNRSPIWSMMCSVRR